VAERCARRGYNILTSTPPDEAAVVLKPHRAISREPGSPELLAGIIRYVVVADTDERAQRNRRSRLSELVRQFPQPVSKIRDRPLIRHAPDDVYRSDRKRNRNRRVPATVLRVLQAHAQQSDANYLVGQFVFGDMKHADAARSIELFARDVMPQLLES